MANKDHYLRDELYKLVREDVGIFDFLQEGTLDGLWYWDLEQPEHEWMSARFWTILGYHPQEKEHLASEWQDIINQEDLQTAIENLQKHSKDPSHPYDQVVRYTHRDGHTVWLRCRGKAVRDETGKPIRLLGAHTDLTAQKRAEQALREKAAELEIANAQLKEALDSVKTLSGLIPICAWCKKARDDSGYWEAVEKYVADRSEATFSHGMCPECSKKWYPEHKRT